MLNRSARYFSHLPRKAKTKKMTYHNVPAFMQARKPDPFDYKLRSREEVLDSIKYDFKEVPMTVSMKYYDPIEAPLKNKMVDMEDCVAKAILHTGKWKLST